MDRASVRTAVMSAVDEVMCGEADTSAMDDGTSLSLLKFTWVDWLELLSRLRIQGLSLSKKDSDEFVGEVGMGHGNGKIQEKTIGEVVELVHSKTTAEPLAA